MPRAVDLKGKTYFWLKVVEKDEAASTRQTVWTCKCKCGKYTSAFGYQLKSGAKKSCGCRRASRGGHSYDTSYQVWKNMLNRCYRKEDKMYHRYGGRGIRVCRRWRDPKVGFKNFLEDMGKRPPGLELDRQKNDKGYSKSNCRWVTHLVNSNNTERSMRIPYKGKLWRAEDLGNLLGVHENTVRQRYRNNKPLDQRLHQR